MKLLVSDWFFDSTQYRNEDMIRCIYQPVVMIADIASLANAAMESDTHTHTIYYYIIIF